MLAILMYHYVRDLARTRYPRINGLRTGDFESQLDYICGHYSVCSFADIRAALRGDQELPRNACVLTFDDGLVDHYETVFPRLEKRRLTAGFFPSARPIEERCVLDVHKIQFLIASVADYDSLLAEILRLLAQYRDEFAVASDDELRNELGAPNRFDRAEVAFIKRLLQWGLPQPIRSNITAQLFRKYVTGDEAAFS